MIQAVILVCLAAASVAVGAQVQCGNDFYRPDDTTHITVGAVTGCFAAGTGILFIWLFNKYTSTKHTEALFELMPMYSRN